MECEKYIILIGKPKRKIPLGNLVVVGMIILKKQGI
jgi:hypothetical protein